MKVPTFMIVVGGPADPGAPAANADRTRALPIHSTLQQLVARRASRPARVAVPALAGAAAGVSSDSAEA